MKLDAPEEESTIVLGASKFGWCQSEQHEACPAQYQRFLFEKKGRGKEVVKYLDEWHKCPCKCHGKIDKSKVTKTRRRRRKS